MNIIKTKLDGVVILEPQVFGDERGYFMETYSQKEFEEKVAKTTFVQDNESKSTYGVLRGLHFQLPPYAQSKLVRVVKGEILDVCVDLRKGSPTYGQHYTVDLTEDNKRQIFIPQGFAHGFVVYSQEAIVQYKCDNFFEPDYARGILWNDPALGIDWRLEEKELILSEKDKINPTLSEWEKNRPEKNNK